LLCPFLPITHPLPRRPQVPIRYASALVADTVNRDDPVIPREKPQNMGIEFPDVPRFE
jgi:hypothetical protein